MPGRLVCDYPLCGRIQFWVRTRTNASLLHLRDNYRKLIDCGANEAQISIDGADKSSYEAIRRQALFERLVANCRLLNDECARHGIQMTKMWVVLQQRNRHLLVAVVDLAEQLGSESSFSRST
jgi:MoaA/NifB/PqqE/SkfB family radical SAM enzyme